MKEKIARFVGQMGNFKLDENDMCCIRYDDEIDIFIDASDNLIIYAEVCILNAANRLSMCEAALSLNVNLVGQNEGFLGMNPLRDAVVYTKACNDAGLGYDDFVMMLRHFGEDVFDLRQRLVQEERRPEPSDVMFQDMLRV